MFARFDRCRNLFWPAVLWAGCLLVVAAGGLMPALRADATPGQTGPQLVIDPPGQEVGVGRPVSVSVDVRDVVDLGAFQFTLRYDQKLLRFKRAVMGPFLGSTGRTVLPQGPFTQTGQITFGAVSVPGAPGPSGTGVLASLSLQALRPGVSSLTLTQTLLGDTQNRPITVTATVGGNVLITGQMPTETPGPISPRAYLPFATNR
jgi:hypothetical protein